MFPLWQVASGFAHGRPWAFEGFLRRNLITMANGHHGRQLSPRQEFSLMLPWQAALLLFELIKMRDRRAGLDQS